MRQSTKVYLLHTWLAIAKYWMTDLFSLNLCLRMFTFISNSCIYRCNPYVHGVANKFGKSWHIIGFCVSMHVQRHVHVWLLILAEWIFSILLAEARTIVWEVVMLLVCMHFRAIYGKII